MALVELSELFPRARIIDSRSTEKPYRAVHLILHEPPFNYEIQLRSELQDEWAQVSELYAVRYGQEVKYGGGPRLIRSLLNGLSQWIASFEQGTWQPDPEVGMYHSTREDFLAQLNQVKDELLRGSGT